jgi:hypothetical protein
MKITRRLSLTAVTVIATLAISTLTPVQAASAASFSATPTPEIVGISQAYQSLTVDAGTWAPTPSRLAYQWYAAGKSIKGATHRVYVVPPAMVGKALTVKVTASRGGYTAVSKVSAPTDPVAPALEFTLETSPSIASDEIRVGLPVSADPGEWLPVPDSFSYQWYANGSAISGAKSQDYTPTSSRVSKTLTVKVTAYLAGYTPKSKVSSPSTKVLPSLSFTSKPVPTMSGTFRVGSPVSVVEGEWSPIPSRFTYQWYSNGVRISGATSSSYTPTSTKLKKQLSVRVTAQLPGYTSTSKTSAKSPKVQASSLTAPTIYSVEPVPFGVRVAWVPNPQQQEVTDYLVTAKRTASKNPSGCSSSASSTIEVDASNTLAIVDDLCVGAAYTISIVAAHNSDVGPTSKKSRPAAPTPASVPDGPSITDVLGRDQSAIITWTKGSSDGGSAVTSFDITASDGETTITASADPGATTTTLTGLTNGVDYAVTVSARNDVGQSIASSRQVTPAAAHAPNVPRTVSAIPGTDTTVDVSWEEPDDNGGSDISGYTVEYVQVERGENGEWQPKAGAPQHSKAVDESTLSASLTEFEAPTGVYAISVTASNAYGASSAAETGTPVSPTVVLHDEVVVLDQGVLDVLLDVGEDTLAWSDSPPDVISSLAPQDVVVGGTAALLPEGLLRRVESIEIRDGLTVVTTSAASIADVFADATTSASISLDGAGSSEGATPAPTEFRPAIPGVAGSSPVESSAALDLSSSFRLGISLALPDTSNGTKTEVEGSLTVAPSMHIGLDVGLFSGVALDANQVTKVEYDVKASVAKSYSWQVGELHMPSQTIVVGVVPVVIVPVIPVNLEIGGKASISMSASMSMGSGFAWSSQNPDRIVAKDLSKPLTVSGDKLAPAVSFSGWVALKVGPIFKLYGITGPGISVTLKLQATLHADPAPGDPWLTIAPSIEIAVLVKFKAFGIDAEASAKLAAILLPKFELGGAPPAAYLVTAPSASVQPGSKLQFTAKRSDNVSLGRVWSVSGGLPGDTVSSSGAFTPTSPSGRSVTVVVRDSTGAVGQLSVVVGKPFDPPKNVTVVGGTSSLSASWSAPTRTGGGSIVRYTVETMPAASTVNTTTRSAVISNLASAEYQVLIRAVNSAGEVSSPAIANVYVGPQPTYLAPSMGVVVGTPSGSTGYSAERFSCSSASTCVTSGLATKGANSAVAFQSLSGGAWTPAYLDGAPRAGSTSWPGGLTCPSTTWCLASGLVGTDPGSVIGAPVISVRSGGVWTKSALPIPAGSTSDNWDTVVSGCPTAALDGCVVAARTLDDYSYWAWTYADGAWHSVRLLLADPSTMECPAALACVIAGRNYDGRPQVAVQSSATSWTIKSLGTGSVSAWAMRFSCGAAHSCTLVTQYSTSPSVQTGTLLESKIWTLSGSVWSQSASIPPPTSVQLNNGAFQAGTFDLTCWSAGECILAGLKADQSFTVGRFAMRSKGGVWAPISSPGGLPPIGTDGRLFLDCTDAGECVYSDANVVATTRATGSSWKLNTTRDPVQWLSCPPTGTCTVLTLRGGSEWRSLSVPSP